MRRLLLLLCLLLLFPTGIYAQNRDYAEVYNDLTKFQLWPETAGEGAYWGESAYPFYLSPRLVRRRRIHQLTISGQGYELLEREKDTGDPGREGWRSSLPGPERGPADYAESKIRWRNQYEYDRQGRLLRAEWQDTIVSRRHLNHARTNRRRVLHRYDAAGRLLETRLDGDCASCESGAYDRITIFPQHRRVYYFYTADGQLSRRLTKTYKLRAMYGAQPAPGADLLVPKHASPGSYEHLMYRPYWEEERYRYDEAGRLLARSTYLSFTDSLLSGPKLLIAIWAGFYDTKGQLVRAHAADADMYFPDSWSLNWGSMGETWSTTITSYVYRGNRLISEQRAKQRHKGRLDVGQFQGGTLAPSLAADTARRPPPGTTDTLRYDRRGRLMAHTSRRGAQPEFGSRWRFRPGQQYLDFDTDQRQIYRQLTSDRHGRIRTELVLGTRRRFGLAISKLRGMAPTLATPDSLLPLNLLLEWQGSSVFHWQFDYRGGLLRRAELRTAYNRSTYRRQPQDTVDNWVARQLLLAPASQLSRQVRQVRRRWPDWPANTFANRLFDQFEYEFYPR